jgi:hypothetical protein
LLSLVIADKNPLGNTSAALIVFTYNDQSFPKGLDILSLLHGDLLPLGRKAGGGHLELCILTPQCMPVHIMHPHGFDTA